MTDEQADKIIGLLGVIAERLAHPMVAMAPQMASVALGHYNPYEQRPNLNGGQLGDFGPITQAQQNKTNAKDHY